MSGNCPVCGQPVTGWTVRGNAQRFQPCGCGVAPPRDPPGRLSRQVVLRLSCAQHDKALTVAAGMAGKGTANLSAAVRLMIDAYEVSA